MVKGSVVLAFLFSLAEAKCPGNGDVSIYGDLCQYKCHCRDNEQCDVVTGECISGCALGWMGPGCQYVNLAFDKGAVQSVTYTLEAGDFGPDQAVDGDNFTCSRATSTASDNPRWSVDLGETRYITSLVLIVPVKSPAILDGYDVFVSNETFADDTDLEICYWQQASEDPQKMTYEIICFQPIYGQFVTVRKRSATPDLELCEVQVYGGRELAFKKPSMQSSTLQPMNGAGLANDGVTSGADILQCSITHETAEPYWQVDLGQIFTISQIVIHNSHDQYAQSLSTYFGVSIKGEAAGVALFQHINDGTTTNDMVISLAKPVDGRYVTITLPGNNRQLIICEMEVFGDCPENHCNMDCSANCWCNTTITGTAQLTGICPYLCSDQADAASYPQCNLQSPDSVISESNMDMTTVASTITPDDTSVTAAGDSEIQTTITSSSESEMLATTTNHNEEGAAVETSSKGDVMTTMTTVITSTRKDMPTSAPDVTENPIEYDDPVLPVLPVDGVCPPSEDGEPTFGDQCQYRCHCAYGPQCLPSGGCPNNHCAAGWNGGSCQYENLAFNQNASQESTASKDSLILLADRAVDSAPHSSCSQTNPGKQSWWSVDLGQSRYVVGTIITVPFLQGEFGPYLDNFTIYVSNDSDITSQEKVLCYKQSQNHAPWFRVVLEFLCFEPIWGRYVTVQQQEDYKDLHICDFVVYGGRDLSFRKPVSFSSKLSITPTQHQAMFGVEYTDTLCTATEISQDPWWTIDLGQTYTVQRIKVHLPQDMATREEMHDFHLTILSHDDKQVTYKYSAEGSSLPLINEISLTSPADGRYIMIRLLGESRQLSLCGVDVFGDCPVDRCYLGCDQDCFCNSIITGISKDKAICPYGCGERALAIGDSQNICHKRCNDSYWGVFCHTLCGSCLDEEPCNAENGNCENGCAPGFIDPPFCVTPSSVPIEPNTNVEDTDSEPDTVTTLPVKVAATTTLVSAPVPADDNVNTVPDHTETDDILVVDDGADDPGNEIEEEKLEPGTNGDPVSDFETPGHEIEEDIDLDVATESPDQNTNIDDTGHQNMPSMDTDGKPLDAAKVNNPELGMLGKEKAGKDTAFSERQEKQDSGFPGSSFCSVYNSKTIIFANTLCLLVLLICSK